MAVEGDRIESARRCRADSVGWEAVCRARRAGAIEIQQGA
jgi:hypothetical protein